MKPVLLLAVVGLLCVVLTEVLGVFVMAALPPAVDVVGNMISFVVAPVVVFLAVTASLTLTKPLRGLSLPLALIFPASFAGFQFWLLMAMGNPAAYCLSVFAVTAPVSVLAVLWRRS